MTLHPVLALLAPLRGKSVFHAVAAAAWSGMHRLIPAAWLGRLTALIVILSASLAVAAGPAWKELEPGLDLAVFPAARKAARGDSSITILRIDPQRYQLVLLSAKAGAGKRLPARQWARKHRCAAVINAGMYLPDGLTHAGYLKHFDMIDNPRMAKRYNAVLAFNPRSPLDPPVRLFDLTCDDFASQRDRYQSLVQNLRMIGCGRTNVWVKESEETSMAVLGMDAAGSVLFIFTQSPYRAREFADMLLSLPVQLTGAMYLEGGSEAALYVGAGGIELSLSGSSSLGPAADPENDFSWPLPHVIGVVKK